MKPILAISFLVIYFLALLNPIAPYIDYSINKAEIIEKYCENKDKPILKCEGKCHLKKQLIKAVQTEENKEESFSKEATYPIGSIHQVQIKTIKSFIERIEIPTLKVYISKDLLTYIDHPPQYV
tara:strand:- start:3341 stop:3712 length:372 start_codon:yes stop_codon:yes gene_type:complete